MVVVSFPDLRSVLVNPMASGVVDSLNGTRALLFPLTLDSYAKESKPRAVCKLLIEKTFRSARATKVRSSVKIRQQHVSMSSTLPTVAIQRKTREFPPDDLRRVTCDRDDCYFESVIAPWRTFNKISPPIIPRLMLRRVPIRKYSAKRTDFISG
jgi:hypothetical protein